MAGARLPDASSTNPGYPTGHIYKAMLPECNIPSLGRLMTLIGLAAKNAILIVEFAKERVDRGMDIKKATLEAVQLRLRPIVMTSLAFILGVMPLVFATGAGAVARNTIGFTVLGGMLAASSLAIFIVPVLFVVITRLSYGKKQLDYLIAHHDELMEKAKKAEGQNIDAELEFEIAHAHDHDKDNTKTEEHSNNSETQT